MFALNQEGKFLYISETVSIYLGLSQVTTPQWAAVMPGLCTPLLSAGLTDLNMKNRQPSLKTHKAPRHMLQELRQDHKFKTTQDNLRLCLKIKNWPGDVVLW